MKTVGWNNIHAQRGLFPVLLVLLALALATVIYWPGLHGDYLFDDYPNIVENTPVHVTESSLENWYAASQASPSRELRRPLAMLSFAANHYLTGGIPFWFKLTNLGIHLASGLLLFLVLSKLFGLWKRINHSERSGGITADQAKLLAALVAAAWLVAPINLTAVLYVVQRMTSLAQLFILAGLWAYLHGRTRQLDQRNGWAWLLGGLIVAPVLGLGAKETPVLLPGFALACELALLKFQGASGRRNKPLLALFAILIGVPLILAALWLLPGLLQGSFGGRSFTLAERLLTEGRVLVSYIHWTLLPIPDALSFYHDDIAISSGWFSPPSTAVCAALLASMALAAFACLRQAPLIALGLLWFFAGHVLTATIIPLELVFEHRNYFASAGLLLAALALLMRLSRFTYLRLPMITVMALLIAWPAVVTAMRSLEWSSPLRLAASEAKTHPNSPRAQYEFGRALVIATDYGRTAPLMDQARAAFTASMQLPDSGIQPEQGLIMIAGHTGETPNPAWWASAAKKIRTRAARAEEVNAIHGLLVCQLKGSCAPAPREMLQLYLAALKNAPNNSHLLASYAQFAAFVLNDCDLALRVASQALEYSPNISATRNALGNILEETELSN